MFNLMARWVQYPTLRFVKHQPRLRKIFEFQARLAYRPCPGVAIAPATWGGVSGLEIRPDGRTEAPSLLYVHGGGFTIGSAQTHKWLVARLAKGSGRVAFVPDYRLAPKHPFPAAVEDVEAVYDALAAEGPIAVAGDSAGGCLALGLCGTRQPERALLLSPIVDVREEGNAAGEPDFSREILLPEPWIRLVGRLYLKDAARDDPRASPILHDLSQAPPTLIQAAIGEALEAHARSLAEVLPDVRLSLTPNVAHVWQLNAGWQKAADAAVAEGAAFLRRA